MGYDIVKITPQHICRNLGQCCIAAGTHVGSTQHQGVEAVVI